MFCADNRRMAKMCGGASSMELRAFTDVLSGHTSTFPTGGYCVGRAEREGG